jgi:TolA-binding protein
MMSCRQVRSLVVEELRGAVIDVAAVDEHVGGCAACRQERARWQTVGALKRWRTPSLAGAARERIAARLRANGTTAAALRRAPTTRVRWAAFAAAAVVALALAGWRAHHTPSAAAPLAARQTSVPVAARQASAPVVVAPADSVVFAGAELRYHADTRVRFRAADNEVAVDAGALEVKAASLSRPVRLVAARFRVVLRHAHVVIAADGVRVLDGSVEVYSIDAQPLAIINAGGEWRPTDAPAPAVLRRGSPRHADRRAAPDETRAAPDETRAALDETRAALARGDGAAARLAIRRALAGAPSPAERAQAELFGAESYLVEGATEQAIAAYREVALAWPRSAAGESAAFAAAQLLVERGRRDDAELALRRYLEQYPDGRFAREASERLADLRPAQ